jgi:hypothetical protein
MLFACVVFESFFELIRVRSSSQSSYDCNNYYQFVPFFTIWIQFVVVVRRQRMKEKAMQLYIKDHPNSEIIPETKQLRKEGYLQTAKTLALREVCQEKKAAEKHSY